MATSSGFPKYWSSSMKFNLRENRSLLIFGSIYLLLLLTFQIFYQIGYNFSIDWEITSTAETHELTALSAEKGPFMLDVPATFYTISEQFYGGDIQHSPILSTLFASIVWIGFCGILAVASFFRRFWFLGVAALAVLYLNQMDLDTLGLLGSRPGSKWVTALFIFLTIGPAYYFHAFTSDRSIGFRWLILSVISGGFLGYAYFTSSVLIEHMLAYSHFGVSIIAFLFIFLIAEEIVFAILYVITQSKGGDHNEKHFLIFGLFYVGYLGLYYAKEASLIRFGTDLFDPFYLLLISSILAVWSFRFKQGILDGILTSWIDVRWLLMLFGIITFSYLSLGFSRGNDPVKDAMHYIILYAHLGFGFMFLAYIVINFIDPLAKGMQVYRIAYKEFNFPYASARLGGLAAIAGFFFLSENEAYKQIMGGYHNYMGDLELARSESRLAMEYFRQGSVYAWDNHYSNYQLGQYYLGKGDRNEFTYRFTRASKRNPSPYAYVNAANSNVSSGEQSKTVSLLNEALTEFPKNAEISNNLALALKSIGSLTQANRVLSQAHQPETWNNATLVNRWNIGIDQANLEEDYKFDNLAVRTNILATNPWVYDVPAPGYVDLEKPVNLHLMAFLNNGNLRIGGQPLREVTSQLIDKAPTPEMARDLRFALSMNYYKSGLVNKAFQEMDQLIYLSRSDEKGALLHSLGILALDQNAPRLAADFFAQALEQGFQKAQFNLALCQLELGNWDMARSELLNLISSDSSVLPLYGQLEAILDNTETESFAYRYFRHMDSTPDEIGQWFATSDSETRKRLWSKIEADLIREDNLARRDEIENSIGQYMIITAPEYSSADTSTHNAFDTRKIASLVNDKSIQELRRYEILNDALNINKYSIPLLKSYCLLAIEIGLDDYADIALVRLYELLPSTEFHNFEREFYDARQAQQQAEANWGF